MEITKTQFIKETKGQFNEVRLVDGVFIANVGWHEGRNWKVVDRNDFDIIKERSYEPIAEFNTREELWDYLKEKKMVKMYQTIGNDDEILSKMDNCHYLLKDKMIYRKRHNNEKCVLTRRFIIS